MHLPAAYLDLDGSTIAAEGLTFVTDLHLAVDASIGPFVPKRTKGIVQ